MRETYVKTLAEEGKKNDKIFGIIADIGVLTWDSFKEACPERFVNVGIAEANMVGMAAGLALEGKMPFIYSITSFLTERAFEPIKIDIAYQNLNVKIVGCGSGFSYSTLGCTHHAIDDIAIMRALPNMVVISPADPRETVKIVKEAVKHKGPMYIRIGRSGEPNITPDVDFKIGKATKIRDGKDLTIIGTGSILYNAVQVAEKLKKEKNLDIEIINMSTIKPIDKEAIIESAKKTKNILSLEEHSIIGGLGSAVAEVLAESGLKVNFKRLGLKDVFCLEYGNHEDLEKYCGIDVDSIANEAEDLLKKAGK